MNVLCLLSAITTFVLFGLATDQHHQKRLGTRLFARRKKILRCTAWLGVVVCFVLAFAAQGDVYGAIFWLGALSFGAAAAFLFLNLAPGGADKPRRAK